MKEKATREPDIPNLNLLDLCNIYVSSHTTLKLRIKARKPRKTFLAQSP
ncbi:MAG: hypothetical protein QXT67_02240 [Candidatus Bathyarchaeia archaeon]